MVVCVSIKDKTAAAPYAPLIQYEGVLKIKNSFDITAFKMAPPDLLDYILYNGQRRQIYETMKGLPTSCFLFVFRFPFSFFCVPIPAKYSSHFDQAVLVVYISKAHLLQSHLYLLGFLTT